MKYFLVIGAFLSFFLTSCQKKFDERLAEEVKVYTQTKCPQMIEEGTQLDSLTYQPKSHTLARWYTLSGTFDTPKTFEIMQQQRKELKQLMIEEIVNDPNWKACMEHSIYFDYIYRSQKTGKEIYRMTLTPEDYHSALPKSEL